ncbi:MAG: hypothetical protein AAF950_18120 [Pseudomonadota bacterium]
MKVWSIRMRPLQQIPKHPSLKNGNPRTPAMLIAVIRLVCPSVLGLDLETHEDALRLVDRHRFSIFDAMIVATALRAECQILYSEDMQDGMIVDRRLEIINPFRI